MVSTIGIKIANGEFYSVVEENSQMKKRLVLTTVHDKQHSVQIDLYKSFTKTMADALYIGSLVMENIKPRPKGGPSIELVISSNLNGDITADAVDLDADAKGSHQTLNVSLRSMDEAGLDDEIPDFELDGSDIAPSGFYDKDDETEAEEEDGNRKKRKFPWLLLICAILALTAIGLVVWIFFFQNGGGLESAVQRVKQLTKGKQSETVAQQQPSASQQEAPSVRQTTPVAQTSAPAQQQTQAQPAAQTPAPAAQPAAQTYAPAAQPAAQAPQIRPAASTPVIQAPAQPPASSTARRDRPAAPVASYDVPSVIPRDGVPYRIRYGDTLWDIAEAFYRNPWLYPQIARFNNIRNPDLIISGTTIRVPPRN